MDYPLHYSAEDNNHTHPTNHSENYRNYSVFNDRSDIMFNNSNNNNSTTSTSPTMDNTLDLKQQQNRSRSMLLMSTRPNIMHDPWNISTNNQHSIQPHHSINTTEFNQAMTSNSLHHNFPQAERGIAGFVSKLYQCLQSNDTSQKYARWCHHEGKDMFIIDCIPEFTETVLPRLFKHCKFPSFVRQLNIYGFQRDTDARKSKDTKDKESCRWYHPCFKPGRRDLFHLIRRKATRYSRKKRVKAEEDPETILNLGSGDESDSNNLNDDENIILLVNQDDSNNEQRCSSSTTSSVHNSTTPIEYHPQLHHTISYHTNTTTPILLDTPTVLNQPQQQEESDSAEDIIPNNNLVVDIHPPSSNNVMHEQDLRLQLYQMKRHYEKMQGYFEEQLNTAQIQIDEQRLRIQQLEETLRFTTPKANVKLNTTHSYISATNNYNNYNNNNRLVNQQRSFIDLQHLNKSTTEASTPRPTTTPDDDFNHNSNFYFHENQKIVQIKTETDNRHHHLLHATPPPSSTNTTSNTNGSNTWNKLNHHHRDTTNGMVAAGSNTTPHSSSSIIDNENHNNNNNNNNNNRPNNNNTTTTTAKSTLPIHMNFNTYM